MEYTYNKEYLMRDNKPWFPVMGEFSLQSLPG